jgi:hypothetical protein
MLSAPVLLCIAWARFFALDEIDAQPKWRRIVGSISLTNFCFHIVDHLRG